MKKIILLSVLVFLISGCASNPQDNNSLEFKEYEEYLYKMVYPGENGKFGMTYILTLKNKWLNCGTVSCGGRNNFNGPASAICKKENSGEYYAFINEVITLRRDAKFICFKDENSYQAWNESQNKIKEDREKAVRLAYQQKIERQQAAKEAERLEQIARQKNILESKKERCRSYGFKENTDGFGLCMLEQDRIAAQAERYAQEQQRIASEKAEEQRKREAQALINAGAAILNRNKGNCNFSCPGGQVVQGSCSTSSINVNGKICFKR